MSLGTAFILCDSSKIQKTINPIKQRQHWRHQLGIYRYFPSSVWSIFVFAYIPKARYYNTANSAASGKKRVRCHLESWVSELTTIFDSYLIYLYNNFMYKFQGINTQVSLRRQMVHVYEWDKPGRPYAKLGNMCSAIGGRSCLGPIKYCIVGLKAQQQWLSGFLMINQKSGYLGKISQF